MGDDRRFERPVVHGQREVVANHGNLVGFARLLDDGRLETALRTLQVFEDHDGDLCAFRRTQRGLTDSWAKATEANRATVNANPTRVLFIADSIPTFLLILIYRTGIPVRETTSVPRLRRVSKEIATSEATQ